MNNREFIEQAAMFALIGILANPNTRPDSMDASKKAVIHAESLLIELKRGDCSTEENDINQYIMDVDDVHGQKEIELQKRIEALEYIVENLKQIIENNCPGWINKP